MFTDILSQRFVRTTSLTVHARHSPMSHYGIDHFIVFWMEYEVAFQQMYTLKTIHNMQNKSFSVKTADEPF